MASPGGHGPTQQGEALISPLAKAFLREEWGEIDEALPAIIDAIKSTGACECWHKHSSFLEHLVGTYRVCRLWSLPREVCLCMLTHSAYSNRCVHRYEQR